MIDIDQLASGLANNLLETSGLPAEAKGPIQDAFRRGLRLGLSIRPPNAVRSASVSPQLPKDFDPWTTMH
jgi:hypothetical protein